MDFIYNLLNLTNKESLIIPRLYLSDYHKAISDNFINDKNITVIVNCTPYLSFPECNNDCIKIRIPVYDSLLEKDFILMEDYLNIVIPILTELYNNNHTILIYCKASKQRSAIVTASLLKNLIDNEYIQLNGVISKENTKKQFYSIVDYMLSLRPYVFTYGFRINFKKSFFRYFKIK